MLTHNPHKIWPLLLAIMHQLLPFKVIHLTYLKNLETHYKLPLLVQEKPKILQIKKRINKQSK